MKETVARELLAKYYNRDVADEDINRFIRGAKEYTRQLVIASDPEYPVGMVLVATKTADKYDFKFIPEFKNDWSNFGAVIDPVPEIVVEAPADNRSRLFNATPHVVVKTNYQVKRRRWTQDELDYVRSNYKKLSYEEMAEHLDRTPVAVEGKCWEQGWR